MSTNNSNIINGYDLVPFLVKVSFIDPNSKKYYDYFE